MYCTTCGNKINDGDAFCPICGNRISNTGIGNPENTYEVAETSKSEPTNSAQTTTQKLKSLTVKTCSKCGKEYTYTYSKFSYLYIALIVLGLIFTLVINTIIGLVMMLSGAGLLLSIPCPHCGFSKNKSKDKVINQKTLNKIKNKSNTTFYKTIYELNTKYKAKNICICLLIILAIVMFVPLVTETVDITFYSDFEVEKSITGRYIDIIANISEFWGGALLLLPIVLINLFIYMVAFRRLRLSIVPRVVSVVVAIINIVGIAIFNENRIVEEFYYSIDKWVREIIDSGSATVGAESFGFILINILVVGLVFILYEFEIAILLNENADKTETLNSKEN